MAKNSGSGEDRAKVKFRFYEFELEGASSSVENSIKQITQAFGAKPAIVVQPKQGQLNGKVSKDPAPLENPEPVEEEYLDQEEDSETQGETGGDGAPAKSAKPRKRQVHPLPDYKHDLDLTGSGKSFKDFVASKKITTQTARYLASAFWLKDHGGVQTIDIHKIYTCYKTAGWPTKIEDWDNNFRLLVRRNLFRRVSQGEYAITPLGEDAVRELDDAQ
jgi:hypothetical protein